MERLTPKGIDMNAHVGWCPGCGHGIVNRILVEAIEELGIDERIVMVEDVACGGLGQDVLEYNSIGAAHGRPIVTAAGIKRARPDAIVIARPGDGSAYSIGIESTIHCALRNENILALVVNNNVFGMTGGQMSPESLPGQRTTTSPKGRDTAKNGNTFDAMATLSSYDIAYLARGSVASAGDIVNAKKMIKNALEKQINGDGFCLVELLSMCPTNWNMQPADAMKHIKMVVEPYYKTGEFVDRGGERT